MARSPSVAGASRTLHSQAAARIGQRILSGEWAANDTLPTEADLSRELNVSRASLREAIKLLAGKGLIKSTPRRGTVVQPRANWNRLDPDVLVWQTFDGPTAAFVRDLFELRRMIEPQIAALAAARGSDEALRRIGDAFRAMETAPDVAASIEADLVFHRAILLAAGNELLASFAPAIEASLSVSFKVSRAGQTTQEHVVPLHRAVCAPILARDAEGARQAMLSLLDRSERDAETAVTAKRPRKKAVS